MMIDNFVKISTNDWDDQKILKEKLGHACHMGFFYHEIPEDCQPLIDYAIGLGNDFYNQEQYKSLQLDGVSGYWDHKKLQAESLYLEKKHWAEKMPTELEQLSEKMRQLGIRILQQTLQHCGIKEEDWDRASGGAAIGKGQTHFTFNHYRKDKPLVGLGEHRDFGQITVLFINSKGLEARIEGTWRDVLPLENHFIINYGQALEALINDQDQLTAALHRVLQVTEDRISFGTFADNDNESTIFTTEKGELKDTGDSYRTYLKKLFESHYNQEESSHN